MINYQYGFKTEHEIFGSLEVMKRDYLHYISPKNFNRQEANVFYKINFLIRNKDIFIFSVDLQIFRI